MAVEACWVELEFNYQIVMSVQCMYTFLIVVPLWKGPKRHTWVLALSDGIFATRGSLGSSPLIH